MYLRNYLLEGNYKIKTSQLGITSMWKRKSLTFTIKALPYIEI